MSPLDDEGDLSPSLLSDAADLTPDDIHQALDRRRLFLKFEPRLEQRFEEDTTRHRIIRLRKMIALGLLFFGFYGASGFITAPETGWLNLALRLGAMTPTALLIAYMVARVSPLHRELLGTAGMLGANGVPLLIFALNPEPFAASLSAVEVALGVVYGNVTLPLRFPGACVVSLLTFIAMAGILLMKHELGFGLSVALLLNLLCATTFSLTANYHMEREERRNYLLTLKERLRANDLSSTNTILERRSATDALTGLANRRVFDERLHEIWRETSAEQSLAVVFIDVDYFKPYNDHYGHAAGDVCLQKVAASLCAHPLGEKDLVARYGGEEFVILLPGRGLTEGLLLAERLRTGIIALAIPHAYRKDALHCLSISVGVAATDTFRAESASTLVAAADSALYRAKALGRNRTERFQQEQSGPSI